VSYFVFGEFSINENRQSDISIQSLIEHSYLDKQIVTTDFIKAALVADND
jgi:hypothetical protein